MKISTVLLLLPATTLADFSFYYQTCSTGVDGGQFDDYRVFTDTQDYCGSCTLGVSQGNYYGGNPCNDACEDELEFRPNDSGGLDLFARGNNIGHCDPPEGEIDWLTCQYGITSCLGSVNYICYTDYCT